MNLGDRIDGKSNAEEKGSMKLSVVVPCYNEEAGIESFYAETKSVITRELPSDLAVEYLFVDDGSNDKTLDMLRTIAESDPSVRFLSFSRNFGKEAAIYAGLQHASGDYVITMDSDGQDPPSKIPDLYGALASSTNDEPVDMVRLRRVSRKGEPPIRSFFARMFYRVINRLSKNEIVDGARDYQIMNRKVVNGILQLREYNRFFKGITSWVGFKVRWLEYENVERAAGETKWSFWSLFVYAVNGLIAFTTTPLVIASVVGIICFILALVLICIIVVRTAVFGDPVAGWPSMICLTLLIGSIQLLCIGILGQYLSKLYLEAKHRPLYLVEEANFELSFER